MVTPRFDSGVFNGRLSVARPRRKHVEVKVYAGETEDSPLVKECHLPGHLRYNLYAAAEQAEMETPREGEGA